MYKTGIAPALREITILSVEQIILQAKQVKKMGRVSIREAQNKMI